MVSHFMGCNERADYSLQGELTVEILYPGKFHVDNRARLHYIYILTSTFIPHQPKGGADMARPNNLSSPQRQDRCHGRAASPYGRADLA
jgi:hypothetical protein